jgi:ribonuclease E
MGGLIVIDFIDMDEPRHDAQVERRLKEAMKNDRARIQVGRISPFGLLELSRQRLHPSLIETNFHTCAHCLGTGLVRSIESAALLVLRAIEEEGIKRRSAELSVTVAGNIALYILNQKRGMLIDIEQRYGFTVRIMADDSLIAPEHRIERLKLKPPGSDVPPSLNQTGIMAADLALEDDDEIEEDEEAEGSGRETAEIAGESTARSGDEGDRKRKRRRSRRRRGRDATGTEGGANAGPEDQFDDADVESGDAEGGDAEGDSPSADSESAEHQIEARQDLEPAEVAEGVEGEPVPADDSGTDEAGRRRRRGRRGGRSRSRRPEEGEAPTAELGETDAEADLPVAAAGQDPGDISTPEPWVAATSQPVVDHPRDEGAARPALDVESEPDLAKPGEPAPLSDAEIDPVIVLQPVLAQIETAPAPATEPTAEAPPKSHEYEIINQPPPEPKRGFWKRLNR